MLLAKVQEVRRLDTNGDVADVSYLWRFTCLGHDVSRTTATLDPAVTCFCASIVGRKSERCPCVDGYVFAEDGEPEIVTVDVARDFSR